MKRCLWVVPKGIFPVRDGARVANQALLKFIRFHFDEMDVMLFNEEASDELHLSSYNNEFSPTNTYFLKRATYTSFFKKIVFLVKCFIANPKYPVTTGYFYTKKKKREIQNLLRAHQYDVIVFDGLHPFTTFMDLQEFKNTTVIYRAHNVEGDLWSTAASKTNNTLIKSLLLWQGKKMTLLEMSLIKRAQKVWCIAEEDLKRFASLQNSKEDNLEFIPVGLEFKKNIHNVNEKLSSKIKLLFLGKMDWAPNKDGLKWFLEEVWPSIDTSRFELQIVGSGDSAWGVELFKAPGVKFFGFVKNLEDVYSDCDFSIIPIRYGSGTRIKVIESISKSIPIISTRMGVQGSGLTDFFLAESSDEWISMINSLNKEAGYAMAHNAFIQLEKMYSPVLIAKKAFDSINA